jgi:creatinine amidohydrolase/Fe(II)-dependent formamide hydrolase-like protein
MDAQWNQKLNAHRYQYMRLDQLQKSIMQCPLVIQPTGILEWHGSHMGLGTDGLIAQYICERVIESLGVGVLMPTNWVGTYGYIHYPGTVCYNEETTYQVFKQNFKELIKIGFRLVVLITGHGGGWQMGAINRAVNATKAHLKTRPPNAPKVDIIGQIYNAFVERTPLFHGQWLETSLHMRVGQAYGIDLVDPSQTPGKNERIPLYNVWDDAEIPIHEDPLWQWQDNFRDPTVCSPEIGEIYIKKYVDGIIAEIREYFQDLGL